jgi:hypothetical protein
MPVYGQAPPTPQPTFFSTQQQQQPSSTAAAAYYPSVSTAPQHRAEPFYQSETPGQYGTTAGQAGSMYPTTTTTTYGPYSSQAPPIPQHPHNYELSPVRASELPRYDSLYCQLLIDLLLLKHKILLDNGGPPPRMEIIAALGNRLHEYVQSPAYAAARTVYTAGQLAGMEDASFIQHCADVLDALDGQIDAGRVLASSAAYYSSRQNS